MGSAWFGCQSEARWTPGRWSGTTQNGLARMEIYGIALDVRHSGVQQPGVEPPIRVELVDVRPASFEYTPNRHYSNVWDLQLHVALKLVEHDRTGATCRAYWRNHTEGCNWFDTSPECEQQGTRARVLLSEAIGGGVQASDRQRVLRDDLLHAPLSLHDDVGREWSEKCLQFLGYSAADEIKFAGDFAAAQFAGVTWEVSHPTEGWRALALGQPVVSTSPRETLRRAGGHRTARLASVWFAHLNGLRLVDHSAAAAAEKGASYVIDPRDLCCDGNVHTIRSSGAHAIRYRWPEPPTAAPRPPVCSYDLYIQLTEQEPMGVRWHRKTLRAPRTPRKAKTRDD